MRSLMDWNFLNTFMLRSAGFADIWKSVWFVGACAIIA